MTRTAEQELLERRAAELARPTITPVHAGLEVLEFAIDRDRYAFALHEVAGIFRLDALGVLPGAKDPLLGIASWRGSMLRILDLRSMSQGRAGGLDDRSWVVAVGNSRPDFGLLVSHVLGPRRIPDDVGEPPDGLATDRRYLFGVSPDGLQVLNPAAIHAAFAQGESR